MKTPANKTDFKQFYQFLLNQKKNSYGYTVMNEITDSFRSSVITAQSFKYLFINLSILLIVFTVLFLLKIVGDTLDKKIKQIGILRALGINFEGLLKIFLMLTLSILMPVYILSVLGTILLNSFMNNYIFSLFDITFPIWQFNLLPFLFILILSVTTAFLGCIFPLLKANKKAPAETIRKGQRN